VVESTGQPFSFDEPRRPVDAAQPVSLNL